MQEERGQGRGELRFIGGLAALMGRLPHRLLLLLPLLLPLPPAACGLRLIVSFDATVSHRFRAFSQFRIFAKRI